MTDSDTSDGVDRWKAAGGPEPMAAQRVDEGECAYEDCDADADYLVQLDDQNRTTTKVCDDCSQENRLWIKENEILDYEVV